MGSTKTALQPGDIFAIPLFLPSFQEWRRLDELIDYRSYRFPAGDPYAFGRLIGHQPGNMDLIEVFRYFGPVPEGPEVILQSGQMFAPVMLAGAFARGRWRPVFQAAQYDKWAGSNYAEITFLMGAGDSLPNCNDYGLWRGGENLRHVPREEWLALKAAGVLRMVVHSGVSLEVKIRALLAEQGAELHYEETVEARRETYPQPRDPDLKLRQALAPFCWLALPPGRCALSLDAGALRAESFAKYDMQGSGYDWQRAAAAFLDVRLPGYKGKFEFDCEADTFCITARGKKPLREFALAFHELALDAAAFEALLSGLAEG